MRLLYSTITCLFICFSSSVLAQSPLQALKDGILVVRLTTNQKKVDYFEKALSNPDLDEKAKARFQKLKTDAIELRNINMTNIIKGFKDSYTFSDYRFIYDTNIKQIDDGESSGIFINPDTYELDESITLPTDKALFYLRAGDYKYGPHPYFITGVVTNQYFKDMPDKVFRSKVKFRERLGTFTKKERDVLPFRAQQIPRDLNSKLWGYYRLANPSIDE